MKKTYFLGLLSASLLVVSNSSYAESIVRMATARVAVNKTTMTKVNGKYQKTEKQVCIKQINIPVVDRRVPGQIQMPPDAVVDCVSDVKGKPVHVMTTPLVMIDKTADIPWKLGQTTDVKLFGAVSFVFSELSSIDINTLQDSVSSMNYSENLSLQELGITLMPKISISSGNCNVQIPPSPGGNPPCNTEEIANLEEYFSSFVYIEDKHN